MLFDDANLAIYSQNLCKSSISHCF